MSSVTSFTPTVDSKSTKKRKAKDSTSSPVPADAAETKVNGTASGENESSYLKELQK